MCHQSLGPCFFLSLPLSLSLSLQLIPWSAETCLAHSPALASKTLSRRRPVPSPPLKREPGAFMRDVSPVSRTLFVFCVNHGISASFSFSLSYGCLWTARSPGQLKDPNNKWKTHIYSATRSKNIASTLEDPAVPSQLLSSKDNHYLDF